MSEVSGQVARPSGRAKGNAKTEPYLDADGWTASAKVFNTLCLLAHGERWPVPVRVLAAEAGYSLAYTHVLLRGLYRDGVVEKSPFGSGGYRPAPPAERSVGDGSTASKDAK